jgi:hypothetical protein
MVRKLDTPTNYNQQSFIDPPNSTYAYDLSTNLASTGKPCTGQLIGLAPNGNNLVSLLSSMITGAGQQVKIFNAESDF